MSRRHSLIFLALLLLTAVPAVANHAWGSYHWARTSNPFTLKTGDNVTSAWDAYLNEAIADWSASNVLDLAKVTGGTNPKNCRPTAGRIEVCNSTYGNNGWLGLAQIWASGTHITQATSKMNDSYFNTATYNTPAWRRLVMCQEIAHDFGLSHQDETFDNANLGSCMDYTNDPDGGAGGASSNDPSNEHPNSHDFQQISSIYSHTDSTTTIQSFEEAVKAATLAGFSAGLRTPVDDLSEPWQWGTPARWDSRGRANKYALTLSTSAGSEPEHVITYVFWAPDTPQGERRFGGDE